jgi:hypothetical protein
METGLIDRFSDATCAFFAHAGRAMRRIYSADALRSKMALGEGLARMRSEIAFAYASPVFRTKCDCHFTPQVPGNGRRELEKKSGRKLVSRENYLAAPESAKGLSPVAGRPERGGCRAVWSCSADHELIKKRRWAK